MKKRILLVGLCLSTSMVGLAHAMDNVGLEIMEAESSQNTPASPRTFVRSFLRTKSEKSNKKSKQLLGSKKSKKDKKEKKSKNDSNKPTPSPIPSPTNNPTKSPVQPTMAPTKKPTISPTTQNSETTSESSSQSNSGPTGSPTIPTPTLSPPTSSPTTFSPTTFNPTDTDQGVNARLEVAALSAVGQSDTQAKSQRKRMHNVEREPRIFNIMGLIDQDNSGIGGD